MRQPPLPPAVMAEIRAQARRELIAEARAAGDLEGVEILERRTLPELERWAIAENAFARRHGQWPVKSES